MTHATRIAELTACLEDATRWVCEVGMLDPMVGAQALADGLDAVVYYRELLALHYGDR